MNELAGFIQDFITECTEGLDRLDQDLVELEVAPDDAARIDRIFRTLHTIKGNCGFLDFQRLGTLAHAGETLLGKLRERRLRFNPQIADGLLRFVDAARTALRQIAITGKEGNSDLTPLGELLLGLASQAETPMASDVGGAARGANKPASAEVVPPQAGRQHGAPAVSPELSWVLAPQVAEPSDEPFRNLASPPLAPTDPPPVAVMPLPAAPPIRSRPNPTPAAAAPPPEISPPEEIPASFDQRFAATNMDEHGSSHVGGSGIRIDVSLLDRLMNLVGELVLTRNQIVQHVTSRTDLTLHTMVQRLNTITSDLQEGFMRTRMQRIGLLWQRFPRVVRDTARQCGKNVRLVTIGAETKLDRTLVEAIAEPLMHTLRNAIDHGIESPHERRTQGKPEQGTITLRAYHQAGQVRIEITDDGAGIDLERVRERLGQAGAFSVTDILQVSKGELLEALFRPGFTTAEKVSSLSGRGVGMDVVKTRIEQAGGSVSIDTEQNVGTTVRMTVPLTLAIIPALVIRCGDQSYAVPQVGVNELRPLSASDLLSEVETLRRQPMFRLRGQLLPLVWLREVLRMPGAKEQPEQRDSVLLVLNAANHLFGLVVDAVTNGEEIVVKPLPAALQGLPVYSGNTMLGNGTLAPILDVLGLARQAGVLSQTHSPSSHVLPPQRGSDVDMASGMLVCEVGAGRRVAFPLTHVRRLDEVTREALEPAGSHLVMPYDDDLLRVIDVGPALYTSTTRDGSRDSWPVVVCNSGAGDVGCLVNRVLDVAPAPVNLLPTNLPGSLGSATLGNRVADVLDVAALATLERR